MAARKECTVVLRCQQAQEKFRKVIFRLSCKLEPSEYESICFLANLPTLECCGKTNLSLHVLSSLEANGHISPWNVHFLESLLSEIHREDLNLIVSAYKESTEYKNALKERKKSLKKGKISEGVHVCTDDQAVGDLGSEAHDRKRRVRALYTLLITHITGLTQVMEILREELNKMGEGGVDQAMESFLQVAEDGDRFTDDLRKVFRDMGIKSNRNSTSSCEETPASTPNGETEARYLKVISSPVAVPLKQQSPVTPAKLPGKKPVPLPRTKCSKQAHNDSDIYENLGPIKQEEGGDDVSLTDSEYMQSVRFTSTPRPSRSKPYLDDDDEEDTTGNTGDSGISEWTGHRACSENNLLDSSPPDKDGCACTLNRTLSDGAMLDSTHFERDAPIYTKLLERKVDPLSDYQSVSYGHNMQRS